MPKDAWRTSSSSYRNAVRRGERARQEEERANREKRRRKKPKKNRDDRGRWYIIPIGTCCRVRKAGSKDWREYTTRREVHCRGYVWRNQKLYGFRWGEWELNVRIGDFRTSREPLPEGAASHLASI